MALSGRAHPVRCGRREVGADGVERGSVEGDVPLKVVLGRSRGHQAIERRLEAGVGVLVRLVQHRARLGRAEPRADVERGGERADAVAPGDAGRARRVLRAHQGKYQSLEHLGVGRGASPQEAQADRRRRARLGAADRARRVAIEEPRRVRGHGRVTEPVDAGHVGDPPRVVHVRALRRGDARELLRRDVVGRSPDERREPLDAPPRLPGVGVDVRIEEAAHDEGRARVGARERHAQLARAAVFAGACEHQRCLLEPGHRAEDSAGRLVGVGHPARGHRRVVEGHAEERALARPGVREHLRLLLGHRGFELARDLVLRIGERSRGRDEPSRDHVRRREIGVGVVRFGEEAPFEPHEQRRQGRCDLAPLDLGQRAVEREVTQGEERVERDHHRRPLFPELRVELTQVGRLCGVELDEAFVPELLARRGSRRRPALLRSPCPHEEPVREGQIRSRAPQRHGRLDRLPVRPLRELGRRRARRRCPRARGRRRPGGHGPFGAGAEREQGRQGYQ